MSHNNLSRRTFLSSLATGTVSPALLGLAPSTLMGAPDKPRDLTSRLGIGAIGLRYQGSVITHKAQLYGDIVGLCDVDQHVREQGRAASGLARVRGPPM